MQGYDREFVQAKSAPYTLAEVRFLTILAWVCGVLFGYGIGSLLW